MTQEPSQSPIADDFVVRLEDEESDPDILGIEDGNKATTTEIVKDNIETRAKLIKDYGIKNKQLFRAFGHFVNEKKFKCKLCFKQGIDQELKLGRPGDLKNFISHVLRCPYLKDFDWTSFVQEGKIYPYLEKGQQTIEGVSIVTDPRRLLVEFAVKHKVPFTVCGSEEMRAICRGAHQAGMEGKEFKVVKATGIKRWINDTYLNVLKLVKKTLRKKPFCLISDGWTKGSMHYTVFIAATKKAKVFLGFRPMDDATTTSGDQIGT